MVAISILAALVLGTVFAPTNVEFRSSGLFQANLLRMGRLTPWEDVGEIIAREERETIVALCVCSRRGWSRQYDLCHFQGLREAKAMAIASGVSVRVKSIKYGWQKYCLLPVLLVSAAVAVGLVAPLLV